MNGGFSIDVSEFTRGVERALKDQAKREANAAEEIADWWLGEAKDLAPFCEGFLTADLTQETGLDGQTRYAAVYVPANCPSASYAITMHEGLYNLGKKSVSKARKLGKDVGPRFITRPMDYGREKIREIVFYCLRF